MDQKLDDVPWLRLGKLLFMIQIRKRTEMFFLASFHKSIQDPPEADELTSYSLVSVIVLCMIEVKIEY